MVTAEKKSAEQDRRNIMTNLMETVKKAKTMRAIIDSSKPIKEFDTSLIERSACFDFGGWGMHNEGKSFYISICLEFVKYIVNTSPELIAKVSECDGGEQLLIDTAIHEMLSSPDTASRLISAIKESIKDDTMITHHIFVSKVINAAILIGDFEIYSFLIGTGNVVLSNCLDHLTILTLADRDRRDILRDYLISMKQEGKELGEHLRSMFCAPDISPDSFEHSLLYILWEYLKLAAEVFYPEKDRESCANMLFDKEDFLTLLYGKYMYRPGSWDEIDENMFIDEMIMYGMKINNLSYISDMWQPQRGIFDEEPDKEEEARKFEELCGKLDKILGDELYVCAGPLISNVDVFHDEKITKEKYNTVKKLLGYIGEDRIKVIFGTSAMVMGVAASVRKALTSYLLGFGEVVWEGDIENTEMWEIFQFKNKAKNLKMYLEAGVFDKEHLEQLLNAAVEQKNYEIIKLISRYGAL